MTRSTEFQVRCTPEEKSSWREAAGRAHLTPSAWLRQLANDAASVRVAEPIRIESPDQARAWLAANPGATFDDVPERDIND